MESVHLTLKAIGASCITVKHGLKTTRELDSIHYLSLENLLENLCNLQSIGRQILKAIA